MSEFRTDPFFDTVVLVARERTARPHRIRARDELELTGPCPLCPGNESLSPPEIARIPAGHGRWQSRAFANRYPIVELEAEPLQIQQEPAPAPPGAGPARTAVPGFGAHEVIVDGPVHSLPFWSMDADYGVAVLTLLQSRTQELYRDRRILSVQIVKNHGARAGGSLEHPHFELTGLSFVPRPVERLLRAEPCAVCRWLKLELDAGAGRKPERLLAETSRFVALADYAPVYPYQFSIFPREHAPAFEEASAEDSEDLSQVIALVLGRMERMIGELPLNLMIYSRPNMKGFAAPKSVASWSKSMHWFVRVLPRLSRYGGFEQMTGIPIVQVSPEDAARTFREKGI